MHIEDVSLVSKNRTRGALPDMRSSRCSDLIEIEASREVREMEISCAEVAVGISMGSLWGKGTAWRFGAEATAEVECTV